MPLFSRSRLTKSSHGDWPYSVNSFSGLAIGLLLLAGKLRLGSRVDVVFGETELDHQLLERRRRAKGVHADDGAVKAGVARPAHCRRLLDRNAAAAVRRQHRVAVRLVLLFKHL